MQKSKARRSREADMISDLENIDVMIGSGHSEKEDSEIGNSVRRPESPTNAALIVYTSYSTPTQEKMKSVVLPETAEMPLK